MQGSERGGESRLGMPVCLVHKQGRKTPLPVWPVGTTLAGMETHPIPTRRELFTSFFSVGITGFGGVLPLVHHMLVIRKRWITDAEFTELLGLGQILPGPNVVNLAVALGGRFHGASGAFLAFAGLLFAPFCIAMLLVSLYQQYRSLPDLQNILSGLAPAATGLIIGMGLRLAAKLERSGWCILLAIGTFSAIAFLRWPLLPLLLVMVPLAVTMAWYWRKDEP